MSKTIGQQNTTSGNFVGNIITAKHEFHGKGIFRNDGHAYFNDGLSVGTISSPNGNVTIDGTLTATSLNIGPKQYVIYVGKHGINTNGGRQINEAVLNFTTAITLANALTPTSINCVEIICLDAYTYTENLNIPQYVNISAQYAKIIGDIACTGYNNIQIGHVQSAVSAFMIMGPSVQISLNYLQLLGGAIGINQLNSAHVNVSVNSIEVGSGFAFYTANGPIHCDVGSIALGTGGTAFFITSGATITAEFKQILELAPGGTAINIVSGKFAAHGGCINTTTAYTNTGVLDLFIADLSGAEITNPPGVSNVLLPRVTLETANAADPIITAKGDLLTSDGSNLLARTVGANGQILAADSSEASGLKWINASGTGTVTSVDLSAPSEFTVSGNPVTGSGTLNLAKSVQSANTVWAGPASGPAATSGFRALTFADVPSTNLNTADTIVSRDASGNFAANTITANLSGTATNFSGSLVGDVTGTQGATVVSQIRTVPVSATLPTLNQALVYNGSSWAPANQMGGGGASRYPYNLTNYTIDITGTTLETISTFQWNQARYSIYISGTMLLRVTDNCSIRLRSVAMTTTTIDTWIITTNASTTTSYSFTLSSLPTSDCTLELQVSRPGLLVTPVLLSAVLEFNT